MVFSLEKQGGFHPITHPPTLYTYTTFVPGVIDVLPSMCQVAAWSMLSKRSTSTCATAVALTPSLPCCKTKPSSAVFFFVYHGPKSLDLYETGLATSLACALGLGVGVGILMIRTVMPYVKKRVEAKFNEDGTLKPVCKKKIVKSGTEAQSWRARKTTS